MNLFIAILLVFALAGLCDKIFGGRWHLASAFDQGLNTMGSLCLSMSGIYCIAITFLNGQTALFQRLNEILPFDASILSGVLLAPDMGGFAIAGKIAASPELGMFSGLLLSSTLGCLLSFVLPIALGVLKEAETSLFMNGVLFGILTLPLGLFVGGWMLGLYIPVLIIHLCPVILLCLILAFALKLAPKFCLKALTILGLSIRILGLLLFAYLAAGIFFPQISVVEDTLLLEAQVIVLKITVVVCGSMVAVQLALTHCKGILRRTADVLHVNEYAAIGLFISLATSISMLPLYEKMDRRGKLLNAAFSVSGAFCLGGQLAFVSSVTDSSSVTAYLVCKLVGGIAAVLILCRRDG